MSVPPPAASPIVLVGSPTALGGHFGGMEQTPSSLRRLGLPDRLRERPAFSGTAFRDAGDAPNEPGWAPDPDRRAKNRSLIAAYLPRLATRVATALRDDPGARLLLLGGDCTSHAGALAGLRRTWPGARIALAWFDAHGDFNTPDTTPSGNVWGMPFAMACGRGDQDLVVACDGPTVREEDAALLGGQVLDEAESRMLAASPVAHFGAGMLATDGGRAALDGWARSAATRVDGAYVAFDLDAIDASEGLSLAMPEPAGMSLAGAIAALRILARAAAGTPLGTLGFGATAAMVRPGLDPAVTVDAIAALAEAALG